jgi:hypothetical protein
MIRERRLRRLYAIDNFLQKFAHNEEEPDIGSIPTVSASGQFGTQEVFKENWNLDFRPEDLNEAIRMHSSKEWIAMPSMTAKLKLTTLYMLDPMKATDHEKYFGIKTEAGYVHTPATMALSHAVSSGGFPRKDLSGVKMLEVPQDHPSYTPGGAKIATLGSAMEASIAAASYRFAEEVNQRPELLRRMRYNPETARIDLTTSHSRGIREPSIGRPISEKMVRRQELLGKGLDKEIGAYDSLNRISKRIVGLLSTKIDDLIKEQGAVNRTVRFEGSAKETDDILRQNIARLLLKELTGKDGPLSGVELGLAEDIRLLS